VARWRQVGRKVVFTNGCFDLLHQGHARYLAAARKLGDALVIGVNSDASVRRIKGEKRPILPEDERAELLASLECVDLVVLFEEDDPGELIKVLKPSILVKGADWPKEKVIGRETVEALGGEVLNIPLVEGRSTTSVIQTIKERF
jgi:rfaE bifunctional protein nucleotidyltransferase chain/domain